MVFRNCAWCSVNRPSTSTVLLRLEQCSVAMGIESCSASLERPTRESYLTKLLEHHHGRKSIEWNCQKSGRKSRGSLWTCHRRCQDTGPWPNASGRGQRTGFVWPGQRRRRGGHQRSGEDARLLGRHHSPLHPKKKREEKGGALGCWLVG